MVRSSADTRGPLQWDPAGTHLMLQESDAGVQGIIAQCGAGFGHRQ